MAAVVYQLYKVRTNQDPDRPAGTLYFRAQGSEDENAVVAAATAAIPAEFLGNPQQNYEAEHIGGGNWEIVANYGPIPPLSTGLTIWEIDFSGAQEKIYQSLNTHGYAAPGALLPEFFGAIGVNKDNVEGVDVIVPKMLATAKRKYLVDPSGTQQLPSNYLDQLEQLVGRTNQGTCNYPWLSFELNFEAGELVFLGATVSQDTHNEVQIDHKFGISRNRLNMDDNGNEINNGVVLQGFPDLQIAKRGWEYLWVTYLDGVSNGNRIKIPQAAFVEQVYDEGDYTVLQI